MCRGQRRLRKATGDCREVISATNTDLPTTISCPIDAYADVGMGTRVSFAIGSEVGSSFVTWKKGKKILFLDTHEFRPDEDGAECGFRRHRVKMYSTAAVGSFKKTQARRGLVQSFRCRPISLRVDRSRFELVNPMYSKRSIERVSKLPTRKRPEFFTAF